MPIRKQFTLRNIAYQALLILLAIWPALYNRFPLVTPDTGAYVHSGIKWSLGIDRPVGYGLFIFFTSWKISLWGPVLAQGAIFSWLIQMLCKSIMGTKASIEVISIITILLTFGTAAAWYNGQLMADAFSGMLVLAILLLFSGNISRRLHLFLLLLIFSFQITHTSHIIICLLSAVALFAYFRVKKQTGFAKISRSIFLISICSYLIISLSYAIGGYGFRLSPSSHMFLMSRMAENGILDKYLEEHCATEQLSLCDFQGKTGNRQWEFMWSGGFPHSKENGWIATREEYNKIIYGSLLSPKYLGLHIVKNTEAGLQQLAQLYVGDGIDQQNPPGSSPYNNIEGNFKHEIKEFSTSCQNSGKLPLESINFIITLFTVLISIAALFLYVRQKSQPTINIQSTNWGLLFGITILLIILNAFVTATFSTIIARLQSRIFWTLPAICTIYIFDWLLRKRNFGKALDDQ